MPVIQARGHVHGSNWAVSCPSALERQSGKSRRCHGGLDENDDLSLSASSDQEAAEAVAQEFNADAFPEVGLVARRRSYSSNASALAWAPGSRRLKPLGS